MQTLAAIPGAHFQMKDGSHLVVPRKEGEAALLQGKVAGKNMAGAGEPYTALPHYFSTLFECGFSVWGDFSQWDQTLLKGEMGLSGASIFYLEKGRLCGILQFEPVEKEEAEKIERLVRKRPSLSAVEALAQDAAKSLPE